MPAFFLSLELKMFFETPIEIFHDKKRQAVVDFYNCLPLFYKCYSPQTQPAISGISFPYLWT